LNNHAVGLVPSTIEAMKLAILSIALGLHPI
jgi:hypothetical protein